MPILSEYRLPISRSCPFHLSRDYFWWPVHVDEHDGHNFDAQPQSSSLHWTCPTCGQHFHCSQSLFHHWEQTHLDQTVTNYVRYIYCWSVYISLFSIALQKDDLVCLADYCDIFRCDVYIKNKLEHESQENFLGYLTYSAEPVPKCDPVRMKLLQDNCHDIIHQCIHSTPHLNVSTLTYVHAEQELADSVCLYLTCDHYNDDMFGEESVGICLETMKHEIIFVRSSLGKRPYFCSQYLES